MLLLLLLGCPPTRDCGVELWYAGEAQSVAVVGDFNGWNPTAHPMAAVEGGWRATLELPAGDYVYGISVDGEVQRDVYSALTRWDPVTGQEWSLLRVEDCSAPALQVEQASANSSGQIHVEATFLRAQGGSRLQGATATLLDGTPLTVDTQGSRITASIFDLSPGKHTVILDAADRDGHHATVRLPLWVEETPFSWSDAIIYQVMIDRFAGDDGLLAPEGWATDDIGRRFGGSLAGLRAVVESGYFETLGVNVLWLSPLYENPIGEWPGRDGNMYEGYHGYWPINFQAVEPSLGDEADVEALVAAAHARGVRVVLDVVPNHLHEQHPYRDAYAGTGWFHENPDCICGSEVCPWSEAIQTCWFTDYLPDLAWEHPDVPPTLVADTLWWAERFDLDGYRIDAVPMMPRAAIREIAWAVDRAFEQGPTDFYLVGETFTGQDGWQDIRMNLGPFGLDGQFEFPVLWAVRALVAWGSHDAAAFDAALDESDAAWAGSGSVMAPILGNHDTSRFLSEAAGDPTTDPWGSPPALPTEATPFHKLVMAQAILFSLPGAPVIYQGDEYGEAGANDPDCRRPWRNGDALSALQAETLTAVQAFAQARRTSLALRQGTRQTLLASGPHFVQLRDAGDGQPAFLVVNASNEAATIRFSVPEELALTDGSYADVRGGGDVTLIAGAEAAVSLEPWGVWLGVATR